MWRDTGKPSPYSNQATGRKTEEAGFDSRAKQEIHVFSKASIPPAGSQLTSHSVISGNFSL